MAHLDFYFDYSSPFAYLGATQVGAVAKRHDAQLNLEPFFLGGLFKSIGTPLVPFAEMPQPKQKLAMKDMYRWAEYWDVPFNFCLLYTSPSPRDRTRSRMPSSA